MPLPAFCRSLLAAFLAVAPAFAGPVSEVPALNPSVAPAGAGAVGAAAAGSSLQLSPVSANLSLTPSALPTVLPSPQAAVPAAAARPAQTAVPSAFPVSASPVPGKTPQAAVLPGAKAEPSAAAPVTVREQLQAVSEKAGAAVEALKAPGGGSDADAARAGAKAAVLFDASRSAGPAVLPDAVPDSVEAAPSPVGLLAGTAQGGSARSPEAFRTLVRRTLELLAKPTGNALKGKEAYARGNASEIVRLQKLYGESLRGAARGELRRMGLSEDAVVSHGTTLEGVLGMLFSGGIDATSSYRGMSGESAQVWGLKGIEGAAGYGGTRGVSKGQPGALVVVHNARDPIRIKEGEIMSRAPKAAEDFAFVVVTDGERTVVLDREAVRALAAASVRWKELAVAGARKGDMRVFSDWEKTRDRLEPDYYKDR